MRYAIISDIHANAHALKRVLDAAKSEGVDKIVCLGDVVGYGQFPAETLRLLKEWQVETIAGNHDDAVSGRSDAKGFSKVAANSVNRHKSELDSSDKKWLGALPYTLELDSGAVCVHGDFTDPPKFFYIEDERDALANFTAFGGNLLFAGHTHSPGLFLTGASGNVYKLPPQDFTIEEGKRYIVNPGSVGYPRDEGKDCVSSFVVYDSTEGTVSFKSVPFVVASVIQQNFAVTTFFERVAFPVAVFSTLALIALLAYVGVFLRRNFAPEAYQQHGLESIVVEETAEPFRYAVLAVDANKKRVRANLALKRDSSPVILRFEFLDASGRTISRQDIPVKSSSKKAYKIPKVAGKVKVEVYRISKRKAPEIKSFSPVVE